MSGLEVIGAVAAVVSAFHGGAELVAHIKKKQGWRSSRAKNQQEIEEELLHDSLERGETQVGLRYTQDLSDFGDTIRIGDAIARDRLLQIAVVMQAEVIKSLQLAAKQKNAPLNLKMLHESSILSRNDSIVCLDELKQRILIAQPLRTQYGRLARPTANIQQGSNDYPTAAIIPEPGSSNRTKFRSPRYISGHGQQSSTSSQQRRSSLAGNIHFAPALNHLLQGNANIMEDIDEIISSLLQGTVNGGNSEGRNSGFLNQEALVRLKNILRTLEERQERPLEQGNFQPYYSAPSPPPQRTTEQEHHRARCSDASASSSNYSDTMPPSLGSHNSASDCSPRGSSSSPVITSSARHHQHARLDAPYTPSLPTHTSLDGHYTAPPQILRPEPISPHSSALPQDHSPPIASPQLRTPIDDDNGGLRAGWARGHAVPGQVVNSPAVYGVTKSVTAGPPRPTLEDNIPPLACRNRTLSLNCAPVPVPVPVSIPYRTNSIPQISSGTIQGPTAAQENMMDGRPCKKNNYWGFCKGAWATREEIKRGLDVHSVPSGMFNSTQIWQCRSCLFQGETFSEPHPTKKGKKETIVDPHVHTSAVGIRYKWIFLAKSHVKKRNLSDTARSAITFKMEEKEECNYGCTICSVEGNVTGIYGNVETLFAHIFLEHVRTITDKTKPIPKWCIVGRVADADEEWDLNMPMTGVV